MLRILFVLSIFAACSDTTRSDPVPPGADAVRLEEVASGLENPLYLTAPVGDSRLFIIEQPGRIRVIENGNLLPTPFLDITDRISSGGERGLLSVAFHPDYASNGFFFVNYTDRNGDTRVERYSVSTDPNRADPASAKLILGVEQPFANHNGGLIVFGPDDMLYIGMGDGGSGGDPRGNGQNRGTLLGAMLRIDVDGGDPYAIPLDNPFVGVPGARPEIWAYGLRNPWRFAFDNEAGDLYVADVGQTEWEEVNVVPASEAGMNYGWNIMEGTHCYESSTCDRQGLTLPVLEYGHQTEVALADGTQHPTGCSVTGGYVYRGSQIPELRGTYFYADFCEGWIRGFRYEDGEATEPRGWDFGDIGNILSFGEDAEGELYVLSANGRVYRVVSGD